MVGCRALTRRSTGRPPAGFRPRVGRRLACCVRAQVVGLWKEVIVLNCVSGNRDEITLIADFRATAQRLWESSRRDCVVVEDIIDELCVGDWPRTRRNAFIFASSRESNHRATVAFGGNSRSVWSRLLQRLEVVELLNLSLTDACWRVYARASVAGWACSVRRQMPALAVTLERRSASSGWT